MLLCVEGMRARWPDKRFFLVGPLRESAPAHTPHLVRLFIISPQKNIDGIIKNLQPINLFVCFFSDVVVARSWAGQWLGLTLNFLFVETRFVDWLFYNTRERKEKLRRASSTWLRRRYKPSITFFVRVWVCFFPPIKFDLHISPCDVMMKVSTCYTPKNFFSFYTLSLPVCAWVFCFYLTNLHHETWTDRICVPWWWWWWWMLVMCVSPPLSISISRQFLYITPLTCYIEPMKGRRKKRNE